MRAEVTTQAVQLPLGLVEAKRHLRVDIADDDQFIVDILNSATEFAEDHLELALLTQTITMWLDAFPAKREIRLPKGNNASVSSLSYIDTDAVSQVFSSESYASGGDRLFLVAGAEWPTSVAQQPEAITVTYTSGWSAPSDVPSNVKQAMRMLIGHWYRNRESVAIGTINSEMAQGVFDLLGQRRVMGI